MADIQWIKLSTGLPDNKKIKQLRKLPDGDTIALMWVFLMCLAGDVNDDGMIYFTPEVPYTDEMLADQFDMDVKTIRLGLATFQKFGMIEIINDIMALPSWERWQSTDKLSEIREYNRLAKQRSRAKQKQSVLDMSMTSQPCQGIEEDKEKEIEEEKNKKKSKKSKSEETLTLFDTLIPDYNISEVLEDKIREWLTYKAERKEAYKETGLKSLIAQIKNNATQYGDMAVCDLISECMASNWKGIIFDRLKQKNTTPYQKQTKADELDSAYKMMANWAEGD